MDQETGDREEKADLNPFLRLRIRFVPVVWLGAVLPLFDATSEPKARSQAGPKAIDFGKPVAAKRVIDGDTIERADGEEVRYRGIDAPELRRKIRGRWNEYAEPFAAEALAYPGDLWASEGRDSTP